MLYSLHVSAVSALRAVPCSAARSCSDPGAWKCSAWLFAPVT